MDAGDDRPLWLSRRLSAPVSLVWTDNRSVMISVKGNAASGYRLRVQKLFRQAPEPVWCALAAHVRGTDAQASAVLRQYVRRHQHLLEPRRRQRLARVLHPQGRHFDLEAIYQALNREYFGDRGPGADYLGPSTAAAPAPVHTIRGLQFRGTADPNQSPVGSGVRAAIRGRERRVPRNAAPAQPAATPQRPLVDPHPGVSSRRTPIPTL